MSDRSLDIPNAARWPERLLGDICELISRGTAPVYIEHSEVKAIGQRCVTPAGFDPSKARPHSGRAMANVLRPAPGDVLLNSTGTGTIGRSCVFDSLGSFVVDGHVTTLRPSPRSLDGRWLDALLRSAWGQGHLERYCFSGSTNQVELNRMPLAGTRVPVPPLDEQRTGAKILDTLDTTIRQTEAIIEKLKQVKQGLLHDLLTCGIDTNGELRPPQSQAPHLYKDSPLGWIPESWSVLSLDELVAAPICYGIVQVFAFVPDGIPVLAIKDLLGDYVSGVHRTARSIDAAYLRSRVKPGDILVSIKGTIGRVGLVPDHYAGNISRDIARLRPGPMIRPSYFGQLLRSQTGQQILALAQVGTTRAELSIGPLRKLRFAIPDLREQILIEEALSIQDQRAAAEEATVSKHRAAKIGLMDDLLTGRVRVTPLLDAAARA